MEDLTLKAWRFCVLTYGGFAPYMTELADGCISAVDGSSGSRPFGPIFKCLLGYIYDGKFHVMGHGKNWLAAIRSAGDGKIKAWVNVEV